MPTALETMIERLSRRPLPTDLPFVMVKTALLELGYTMEVTGSHHIFRQPGWRRMVIKVNGKKVPRGAVKDLEALCKELGRL